MSRKAHLRKKRDRVAFHEKRAKAVKRLYTEAHKEYARENPLPPGRWITIIDRLSTDDVRLLSTLIDQERRYGFIKECEDAIMHVLIERELKLTN